MSGLERRGLVSEGTCTPKSALCRDVFDEVVLVSGHVRRGSVFVGTCSVKSG